MKALHGEPGSTSYLRETDRGAVEESQTTGCEVDLYVGDTGDHWVISVTDLGS